MKTSELIAELQEILGAHGDVPVRAFDNARTHEIEVVAASYSTGEFETHIRLSRPTRYGLQLSTGEVVLAS